MICSRTVNPGMGRTFCLISPTRRRNVRDDASAIPARPILPEVGALDPEHRENRVDLPAPLGPSKTVLPGASSTVTPCRTSW